MAEDEVTQTFDRPLRLQVKAPPKGKPPPREPAASQSSVTLAPGELDEIVATAAVQAVKLASAQHRAEEAAKDTDVSVDLQKTVSRLKAAIAAIVFVGTGVLAVLNWYADQRVAAAAEEQRKLDVAKALETISTQHALDQTTNGQVHKRQDRAQRALVKLQAEQGRDTRQLLLDSLPPSKRAEHAAKPQDLQDAEAEAMAAVEP